MEFVSGRPLTPPLSSAAPPLPQDESNTTTTTTSSTTSTYQPTLFDVIYAFGLTKNNPKPNIPSAFLEATCVDSSKQLGSGASFTASVRTLPEGPKTLKSFTDMGGWTVEEVKPAPPRPKQVVFKVAKVAFDTRGDALPGYKVALQSVLTEFHALLYPPLHKHENIVNLLALAWGSNPFDPSQRLPALVLEYAERGTLSDAMGRHELSTAEKRVLCLDVASALQAIHDAGLVHGDVKADNVLLFAGDHRRIAKLGDFGFSVVEESETQLVWLGGTKPWQAPEVQEAIPISEAKRTDTYSFGLLAWSLAINGKDPFRRFLSSDRPAEEWFEELQEFKAQDGLREASKTSVWLPLHLTKTIQENPNEASIASITRGMQNMDPKMIHMIISTSCSLFIAKDEFLKVLDTIFANSLVVQPSQRNLAPIIAALKPVENSSTGGSLCTPADIEKAACETMQAMAGASKAETTAEDKTTSASVPTATVESPVLDDRAAPLSGDSATDVSATKASVQKDNSVPSAPDSPNPSWKRRGFKYQYLSWQAIRDLTPGVQATVFRAYEELEAAGIDRSAHFLFCALLLNGYGGPADEQHALEVLRRSAEMGNDNARAYLYRIHMALGVGSVPGEDITRFLELYGLNGCVAALAGYSQVNGQSEFNKLWRMVTDAYGGVGARWYDRQNMMHGLLQSDLINDDFLLAHAASLGPNIHEYRVNQRGDTLLHFVAACGRHKPLRALIDQYGFNINCRNFAGDTPLICACRSGHGGNAILLLQIYKANAALAATNGETALHWVIAFADASVRPLTLDLIKQGADIDAMTTERICHSNYNGTLDNDFQMPGTPLAWAVNRNRKEAVRVLLEHGASPYYDGSADVLGPLNWAAHFHRTECLKLIIAALKSRYLAKAAAAGKTPDPRHAVMLTPLLRYVVHAADKFSMIHRNGVAWLEALHGTLDLLREESKGVRVSPSFGAPNTTLFYFAVSEAHDEVVQYMLEHHWHSEEINRACGELLRTPVLEAVRWRRMPLVELLLKHDADIHARGCNPYQPERKDWGALHVLAHEGHDGDTDALVTRMIGYGLDVEGRELPTPANTEVAKHTIPDARNADTTPSTLPDRLQYLTLSPAHATAEPTTETPLGVALRSNAFNLSTSLIAAGASTSSKSLSAGLYTVPSPTTILGHIIISNARYSVPRLRYLLRQHTEPNSLFIVEPSHDLSALHRAALAHKHVSTTLGTLVERRDFDIDTNREILRELLVHFKSPAELDAVCEPEGKTALMLAVQERNLGAVEELVAAGADVGIEDRSGHAVIEQVVDMIETVPGAAAEMEPFLELLVAAFR